ncbi:MAG TPA: gas vesicle protein GvpJ [Amycolatopsis sp.]|uniref:gas vesicle protein GvpJ n=1 Tax=Amycolatopsis sp. TaxID=37632 RepID=UPI002B45FF47|nr:gas vesicle protein GvpJ [Amycolatopsis sp.]HKS46894.1 gas vesicle protein GvpJ [Amycolatopsis sp.]
MTAPVVPAPSGGLAEALNILLDKGLVIDASIRVSVIGIEILAIEIKIVIASVDTYIRYLEAMQRLDAQRTAVTAVQAQQRVLGQGLAGTYGLIAEPVQAVATPAPAPEKTGK